MKRARTASPSAGFRACPKGARALLGVMVLGAVGCALEHEPYSTAVWSDTDASWLVVRGQRRIDDRCGIFHDCETTSTTANHELWIHPTDGGEPRQLVGRRDGSATIVFFMESAGYVLAGRTDRWERISLEGDVRIVERRDGFPRSFYIPSPDGSTLVRFVRAECAEFTSGSEYEDCTYRVSFFDADSLEPVGETVERRLRDVQYASDRVAWSPDGHVYFGSKSDAFRVGVDGVVDRDVQRPTCHLGTTSGTRALDGRTVGSEVVDGMVQLRVGDDGEPGWPEQCFGSEQ